MVNRKNNKKRVEPQFEKRSAGKTGLDLRLSAEDRIGTKPSGSKKAATKAPAKPNSTRGKKSRASSTAPNRKTAKTSRKPSSDRRSPGRGGSRKRRTNKKTVRSGALRRSIYWCLVLGIWCGIGLTCVVGYYAAQLPQMSTWTVPDRPPNARIVSVDGKLIANRGTAGGETMPIEVMSPYIPMAAMAIEDHRFHKHFGVDPLGLARAMTRNLIEGSVVQGGSTITQQLAKNLFLEPERTIARKIQEAVLAIWLEAKYTKDEILEIYLNRVYFGSGAYGVDAASRRYFGKSARDVTLAEAALLAGLLKAPSRLSPARDPKAAETRAQIVLAAMRRESFISDREAAQALAMQAKKAKRYWSGSEQYIGDMVKGQLRALIGDIQQDVIVDTTIDLDLQKAAGTIISDTLTKNGEKLNVGQGALVALDGTGAIRALVGGGEYAESQFNRASDAKRQPGSAFKPIVYLTALEAGRTPETIRNDRPVKIGRWTPENYKREYNGNVTLKTALSKSLNTVAAQLVMEVGPKSVVETARRLGIRSKLQANASIALGTSEVSLMELTAAYAPFSNGGYSVTPWLIRRIRSSDGKVLYERQEAGSRQVVRQRELGMMNTMMSEVLKSGTGGAARISGWQAAGKTGTTQNSRDALFVGYTANLVTGIWYGNDDGSPMNKVTGGSLPAQSWSRFMSLAHEGVPVADLPGRYQGELAAMPSRRPARPIAGRGESGIQTGEVDYRATHGSGPVSSGPRPGGDLSSNGGVGRPKGILDLLFGPRHPG
ncbi:MAG: transglycosylase domain-containing protein [Rhizobiaceae bacterium]